MFTTPAPVAPTVAAASVTSTSPSPRQSRLRGLSYLRSYTHSLHTHTSSAAGAASRADHLDPASQAPSTAPGSRTPPISPSSATATSTVVVAPPTLWRTNTSPLPSRAQETSNAPLPSPLPPPTMTRNRAETAAPQLTVRNHSGPTPATASMASNVENGDGANDGSLGPKHLPSIRFIPHQDPRSTRPSLQFPTITRTLPSESDVIRVGRYSERDNLQEPPSNVPSAAQVGFKSKVVSRKHCELWCKDSQWYIKDVKSSSGTFLNHIRLSQPNIESKPFKLKDGDIIQLGIDFRGGEEMIFRCVKIRVECNRGWQQALNTFNKQTHQRLRNLAKKKEGDNASTHTSECSICLMSIAPCQSLFVAPCSHVWHYKCIRPILNGPTWPNFLCPNCRAVADLEADVEDPGEFEEWDEDIAEANDGQADAQEDRHVTPRESTVPLTTGEASRSAGQLNLSDLESALSNINITDSLNGIANQPVPASLNTPQRFIPNVASSSVTQPVAINISGSNDHGGLAPIFQTDSNGLSPERVSDGPMTPRNDAGPFVLDGSAGRGSSRPREGESPGSGSTNAPTLPPIHIS